MDYSLKSPSIHFKKNARISSIEEYQELYQESITNPDTFWAREASELAWQKPWDEVLQWEAPDAKWFTNAKVNVSENCIDRHIIAGKGDKTAILWEGELGEKREISYKQLQVEVSRVANVLKAKGIIAGDKVLIYMPMIPEAAFAMLACARIGAVHTVVFGGFAADAISDRLADSQAKLIMTSDGGYRRGKVIELKAVVDKALEQPNCVESVIVFERTKQGVDMLVGRDDWYHDLVPSVSDDCPTQGFDSEHPLFILYTSGSTGKPKGILHTSGGYLVGTYVTSKYIFDLKDDDIYWCTADVGWITGHSYIVYGPLANGATQVMYEGAPNYPDFGRFWEIIERYKVSIFYTAPTAIRAFIKAGDDLVDKSDISSLRLLGTVGEPINPEAWDWYYHKIGQGNCPIVDTWWQTETGAIMIAPLPGCMDTKPGSATLPFFGIDADILDEQGNTCSTGEVGKLVIKQPWPSMLRGIYKNPQRFKEQYWSDYPNYYTVGDGAMRDEDGCIWITGRLDDVLNISGHRLGTAEVESALVEHDAVSEAAVVGKPHDIKGESIVAFVILKDGFEDSDELIIKLKAQVVKSIGALARPDEIYIVPGLPKTRSGKIMRRLLKELVKTGAVTGNVTTLEDSSIIDTIIDIVAL